MTNEEAAVYKLLVKLQEADAEENGPWVRPRGPGTPGQKALLARIKNARLVVRPNEHPPPHFHVEVPGEKDAGASYDIATLARRQGKLRSGLERAVLEWAAEHRDYLWERWRDTR